MSQEFEEFAQRLDKMRDAYKKAVKDDGERVIKEAISEIFAEHPELRGVRWFQYTPYFNDGDTCEFSFSHMECQIGKSETERQADLARVQKTSRIIEADLKDLRSQLAIAVAANDHRTIVKLEDLIVIKEEDIEFLNDSEEEEEELDDDESWGDSYMGYSSHYKDEPLYKKLKALEKMISGLDDALLVIFDDHSRITLRRGAENFEIEEYEHD